MNILIFNSLTGGPAGLVRIAKLVRWLHSHTVVSPSERCSLTLHPSVSHLPFPICTSCSFRKAHVGPTWVASLCWRVMTIGSARAVVFSSSTPVRFLELLTATADMMMLFTLSSGHGFSGYHSLYQEIIFNRRIEDFFL